MNISDNRAETPQFPAPFTMRITSGSEDVGPACDLIAARAGLAKSRVKDAMCKGAVWLTGKRGGRKHLRKATAQLSPGDILDLFYDARLLSLKPPVAQCLHDARQYSVWFKPAGLLAQGTDYGDHCSLVRQVEVHFRLKRPVLPVHRLDREAAGLMILAHTKAAAAKLSGLLQVNGIDKQYRVTVLGRLGSDSGVIDLPLDRKPAITRYILTAYDPGSNTSIVEVTLETGRLHQIRRHFALIGHPVLGDPKYGQGNKNSTGMELVAYCLAFRCPFSRKEVRINLDKQEKG
ncbi:RluA family pseudouridine synthase [Thiovibrio frasassiensis]|uniref:RluA family pseudouridine synthase n=1 Tax=Thiovibrio frasassiensis TaxID=2984131 RepID=A0A9X4MGV6_9BACT|nr:RluA family pseudouridine synthase [Thiovibrio frasassiensis]MDG4474589.1 RluA family pseudouridine synthase [Thiovibrio frasassiensis]